MSNHETAGALETGEELSIRPALGFVLKALGWVAVLFGLLRTPWVQTHLILPFAALQQTFGCALLGAPRNAVVVDQSCTGSDAMALAIGAILAFPVAWRKRWTGALLGLLVVSAVNTVRIGTLAAVVDNRQLFRFLHLTAWPAVIIVVAAGYVFAWMQWTQRPEGASWRSVLGRLGSGNRRMLRFMGLTVLFVILYYIASIWFMKSGWLLQVAHWATAVGGGVMSVFGVESEIRGNFITTPYGRWVVTQACVATPLVAVYLAAVLSVSLTPVKRTLALLSALPIFMLLGSARLLVLALPRAAIGSHEVAIHAFYQLLAGVVVVAVMGRRRRGAASTALAVGAGVLAGLVVGFLTASWVPAVLSRFGPEGTAAMIDPQGALSILPSYQLGLWVALVFALVATRRLRPLTIGAASLVVFQLVLIAALLWLAGEVDVGLPVIVIRMIALAAPLGLAAWLLRESGPPADSTTAESHYRRFWADVGDNFPDLGEATSTAFYREDEQRLFRDYLSPLDGRRIFKTDLWDEAKNTRILRWAAGEGARAYGIDISPPIAREATAGFETVSSANGPLRLEGAVSDVRAIPFRDGSFDAVYSMGTVEHFDETDHAIGEIFRVLEPGGTAIIGVPNRHDPFLRPLFVALMYRLGLYGYGFEKSYTRKTFRGMLETAGFEVVEETGILFIPGWLRMLELALHSWARPLTLLTWPFVKLFQALSRSFPGVRRHGYLLATVVRRPERDGG